MRITRISIIGMDTSEWAPDMKNYLRIIKACRLTSQIVHNGDQYD